MYKQKNHHLTILMPQPSICPSGFLPLSHDSSTLTMAPLLLMRIINTHFLNLIYYRVLCAAQSHFSAPNYTCELLPFLIPTPAI